MSSSSDQPAAPLPRPSFRECLVASGLVSAADLEAAEAQLRLLPPAATEEERDRQLAELLVRLGLLTKYQSKELRAGRCRFKLGQYTVLDEVGRGGMGTVFKAEHSMMGRVVALKVLPRSKATPESEAAFQREMRILGRLDHPNLVRAFDAGHDAGVHYIVTELVPGIDLKRQVRQHGSLDEVTAASIFSQAARGLAYAHDQRIVHRDVKPGNILVMDDGRAKLLDLGLANSAREAEGEAEQSGRVVGTMDYIAPEQTRSAADVGPQADIYALGCSLYFALSGQVPFPGGDNKSKIKRHRTEPPRPLAELAAHVSEPMCRVVEAMMEKSPERRVARAGDVVDLLARWTPERPVPPTRSSAQRRGRQPPPVPGDSSAGTTTTTDGWDVFEADRSSDRGGTRSDGPVKPAGDTLDRIGEFLHDLWAAATSGRGWRTAARVCGMLVPAAAVGIGFGWAMSLLRDVAPDLFRAVLGDWTPGGFGQCGFLVAVVAQLLARRGETAAR